MADARHLFWPRALGGWPLCRRSIPGGRAAARAGLDLSAWCRAFMPTRATLFGTEIWVETFYRSAVSLASRLPRRPRGSMRTGKRGRPVEAYHVGQVLAESSISLVLRRRCQTARV